MQNVDNLVVFEDEEIKIKNMTTKAAVRRLETGDLKTGAGYWTTGLEEQTSLKNVK